MIMPIDHVHFAGYMAKQYRQQGVQWVLIAASLWAVSLNFVVDSCCCVWGRVMSRTQVLLSLISMIPLLLYLMKSPTQKSRYARSAAPLGVQVPADVVPPCFIVPCALYRV